MEIKDSGSRRTFESGAVRDASEGRGRCDLLALDCVGMYFGYISSPVSNPKYMESNACFAVLEALNEVTWDKKTIDNNTCIARAIDEFVKVAFQDKPGYAMMELSKHYEAGSSKYGEYNWTKGIPCHCYIDSCVRHLLKWYDGWDDEPHDRAVLWNLFGLWWTLKNKPECNDLPYTKEKADEDTTQVTDE